MDSTDTLPRCTTEVYNSLPDLNSATTKFQSKTKDFGSFVASAVQLLKESAFPDGALGAFLLHRHWQLEVGMMMVERPRMLMSGRIGLVTHQQEMAAALASGVSPSRWASDEKGEDLVSLEFSSDPFVGEIAALLCDNRELRKRLVALIHGHGLHTTIGYMAIPRKSIADAAELIDFVETNEDGISIVRAERLSPIARAKSIMTGWPLSSSRRGSVFACCYCSHGPLHSCKHPKPDPPICRPHGCV